MGFPAPLVLLAQLVYLENKDLKDHKEEMENQAPKVIKGSLVLMVAQVRLEGQDPMDRMALMEDLVKMEVVDNKEGQGRGGNKVLVGLLVRLVQPVFLGYLVKEVLQVKKEMMVEMVLMVTEVI